MRLLRAEVGLSAALFWLFFTGPAAGAATQPQPEEDTQFSNLRTDVIIWHWHCPRLCQTPTATLLVRNAITMPRTIKGAQKPKAKKSEAPLNEKLQRIHELEALVLQSATNYNCIAELLTICAESATNFRQSVACTTALRRIFVKLARAHDFPLTTAKAQAKTSSDAAESAHQRVGVWLHDKYRAFQQQLFGALRCADERLQIAALHLLMDFVQLECTS